jgi:regulator of replication initiation timing
MYLTISGKRFEYPLYVFQRMKKGEKITDFELNTIQDLFKEVQNLDSQVIALRGENTRLQAENEFMLRLINDWHNKEGI